MRKTRRYAPLPALLLLAGAALARPGEWFTLTDSQEGFSIRMPGQPQKTVNGKITIYQYAPGTSSQGVSYGLAWRKTEAIWDAEKLLNQNVDDFARTFGETKVLSRTRHDYVVMTSDVKNLRMTTKKSGYPGMEARLQRADGAIGTMIVYVDKMRSREIAMAYLVGREAKYSEEDARRFFDSFVFLYNLG
ncbi:MAG TPA: hypothetical protein VE007_02505 [Thermoanaerobaculia bacterium]|nr:hypothetical protein [Thermoanaerobaculia bacterium]